MAGEAEPLQDAFEEREHEFVLGQGVSEIVYAELLELAGAHAKAATSLPSAPPWRFVGPRNLGGRIIALGQSPLDPRVIYAGSAHGGLWRSIDAGDTWERLGEAHHVFPVGAMAVIAPATQETPGANVVYFGTGAHSPHYVSGRGLFRATIDGPTAAAVIERLAEPPRSTVAPANATKGAALRYTRIRVDPDDSTRFWAASQTGLWRCECPLAQPAKPDIVRDFPDGDNKPAAAKLATTPESSGLWPAHCTDLLVAHDPRERATTTLNGAEVPRHLIIFVAVDSVGVFRGRFDREKKTAVFDDQPLSLPTAGFEFTRIRLAQCERQPQHVYAIMARSRPAMLSVPGSLLTPAVDGLGATIPLQYHASPGTDGRSPILETLLRAGDQLMIRPGAPAADEEQKVDAVLDDTEVTVTSAFVTAIPPAGIAYRRASASDHNHSSEVFHSADSGDTWTKGAQRMDQIGALAGQADYDLVLEVAPDDPRIVIGGEGEVCISTDFGSHWEKILDWTRYDAGDKAQHADQHIAMFDGGDHRRLWVGNDGGLIMARDLQMPAQAYGYWRKRSHGIYAGQCQDVSVNPSLPFMCGVGFQDNGTYLSLGGPTWYQVGGGDGGAIAFHLTNPRQLYVTWQGNDNGRGIEQVDAVAADLPMPSGVTNAWFDLVSLAAGDVPDALARGHRIRYRWTELSLPASGIPLATLAPFVGVLEQHPTAAGRLLAGRKGDAYATINFGTAWTALIPGPPAAPLGQVCALAFGPLDAHSPTPANVDGWAGTSAGALAFTTNAPAGAWALLATSLPFPGAALRISEIAVHPLDRRIVAVSATGLHGRVFLTYDRGRSWIDVTEPVPTALVVAPSGAKLQVGHTLGFTAVATYPSGKVNVTGRAAWSSDNTPQATVVTGTAVALGTEGQVLGLAAGTPKIKATLLAKVANATAEETVEITAASAAAPAAAELPKPTIVPGSLPPGPVGSVIFDPAPAAGAPAMLLAGTLAGVYALPAVPVVKTLAIEPAGPLAFQGSAAAPTFQLRCVATFTDNTKVDATRDVDWSSNAANVTVSNGPNEGRITIGAAAGPATISVHRGGQSATLAVNVQANPAPATPALGAAAGLAANPTVAVGWQRFNSGLPDVLVTDFERVGTTKAIRAATFGLGVFECVTEGGPEQQLYIRQTVVEDGRYPPSPAPARPAAPGLPDDPRLPAGRVALDYTHAFDIRVDAPPYTFFDDVVDGVEFDEQLEVSDPVPAEDNYVYVQVHNSGTKSVPDVRVHLYAAECAATDVVNLIGPVGTPFPASLAAGASINDFYGQTDFEPIGTSKWKRVDTERLLGDVPPDAPRVARFTWAPPAALAGKHVALLALCGGGPLAKDKLATPPAAATLSAFILAERRAALRIVRVAARPPASLYIRDGVADDTRLGGYPVAGRSPDIMVIHPDMAIDVVPSEVFTDFVSRRPRDTVSSTADNFIYVRVHNRRKFETEAQVKVFAIGLNDANEPARDPATWTPVPPGDELVDVTVPASGVDYARLEMPAAADPNPTGTNKTYLLLALVKSKDNADPLPTRQSVDSVDTFWELVSRYVDSDNAAARAVPWV